jgi:hypothetical protein
MKPTIEVPNIKTATEISLRVVGLIMALLSNLLLRHTTEILLVVVGASSSTVL